MQTKIEINTIFIFLNISLILETYGKDRWVGWTRYTTTNGKPCFSNCEQRGQDYFWCYAEKSWKNDYGQWAHCSPQLATDYFGNECVNTCKKHLDYYWCYTDRNKNWNYCGRTNHADNHIAVERYFTRYGDPCVSDCVYDGKPYSWCYKDSKGHWDFCSTKPGYDVNGKECEDQICDNFGERYSWCYLKGKGRSWNYCGKVSVSSEMQYTYLGTKCVSPCEMDGDGSHNKCYDATKKKQLCSPVRNTAVDNNICYSACDSMGGKGSGEQKPSNWCYTSKDKISEWNFCSIVWDDLVELQNTNDGSFTSRKPLGNNQPYPINLVNMSLTRTNNIANLFNIHDDQTSRRATVFEVLPRSGGLTPYPTDREIIGWARRCLTRWRAANFPISNANTIRLAIGGTNQNGVRLDQQSRYSRNGMHYLNLQMQVNRPRQPGQSTTIAEVQVPVEIAQRVPRYVVDALLRSLYEAYAVHIFIFNYPKNRRSKRSFEFDTGFGNNSALFNNLNPL